MSSPKLYPKARRSTFIRGIPRQGFERRFNLADYVEVKKASIDNGILRVDLAREVPEAMKPRKINIAA